MRSYCRLQGVLCVLLALVQGELENCLHGDKCASNQCCLQKYETSDQISICSPLGVEGAECYVPNERLTNTSGMFEYACPCLAGLSCESVDSSKQKGTCVRDCSSNLECRPEGECCSTMILPGNRAKRSSSLGKCRKFATANETCFVTDNINEDVDFLCPCAKGLICQGNGDSDNDPENFLGESGVCVPVDTIDKAIPGK